MLSFWKASLTKLVGGEYAAASRPSCNPMYRKLLKAATTTDFSRFSNSFAQTTIWFSSINVSVDSFLYVAGFTVVLYAIFP